MRERKEKESESASQLAAISFSLCGTFSIKPRPFESGHLQSIWFPLTGSLGRSSHFPVSRRRPPLLSTGTASAHKGAPREEILDISAHIPPLLLPQTWMIWLFDDSLFGKSVSAPYVSNMRRARYLDASPWALWKASAVLQPGGSIDLWTQTCIPHGAKAQWTGWKCTCKETLSQSFASCLL